MIGDARADDLLASLNIDRARAVIIATDDDLANLEVAMDVREMREDIPIVLRLWDQRLAGKVRGVLGVQVSVSTSTLAAPLFASAALDTSVVGVHRIGEQLLNILELSVNAGSGFDGATVRQLADDQQMTVVALRPADTENWHGQPPPGRRLEACDLIHVLVSSDRVADVHAHNRAS